MFPNGHHIRVQELFPFNPPVVDKGPIGALQVFEKAHALHLDDPGMTPGDRCMVNDEIIIGSSSDRELRLRNFYLLQNVPEGQQYYSALPNFQQRHY